MQQAVQLDEPFVFISPRFLVRTIEISVEIAELRSEHRGRIASEVCRDELLLNSRKRIVHGSGACGFVGLLRQFFARI